MRITFRKNQSGQKDLWEMTNEEWNKLPCEVTDCIRQKGYRQQKKRGCGIKHYLKAECPFYLEPLNVCERKRYELHIQDGTNRVFEQYSKLGKK